MLTKVPGAMKKPHHGRDSAVSGTVWHGCRICHHSVCVAPSRSRCRAVAIMARMTLHSLSDLRVVLVETSHPGNIGAAARAMKTMGLGSLWLVRPQRVPDPHAECRASGALDVLDRARVVDDVDDAIRDCHFVIGTSTRTRRVPWPSLDARAAAARILAEPQEHAVAILFGRETSGLTNEELQRCHVHLQIPANPEYPSLNLAMAG